ncbi:MAG: aminotransferase class III-fold pyridoxal phosphate-dependent enzyme, partial [Armatimonadota bacterium]
LQENCLRKGILLIFDEVQTGFGRTGDYFISGYSGIEPDMMTSAKGIASGYPIGLLAVNERVKEQIKQGDLGSTYGGGPVAMAAVKATCELLDSGYLLNQVKQINKLMHELKNVPGVESVHGKGCLIGLKTILPAVELKNRLLKKMIITGISKQPNVLRLLPPIVLEEQHVLHFRTKLAECLK